MVGVRDLVARGYSIPGRTSQKGGYAGLRRSVTHVVSVGHLAALIAMGFGIGTVAFGIDHTPCTEFWYNLNGHNRLASCNKAKHETIWSMSAFAQKKRVTATQLGAKGYDLDIRPSGGNSRWRGWMRREKLV